MSPAGLALLATFCAAALAAASVLAWRENRQGPLARRLAAVGRAAGAATAAAPRGSAGVVAAAAVGAVAGPAAGGFGVRGGTAAGEAGAYSGGGQSGLAKPLAPLRRLLVRLVPRRQSVESRPPAVRRTALLLRQAGLALRPEEYGALVVAAAAALGLLALLRFGIAGAVAGAALGATLPRFWLRGRAAARRKAFGDQLPDALSLMANALRSGHSFLQAAELCGEELPAPAGPEWQRVIQETRVNIPIEDALGNLLERVGSEELDLLVTAVLIQRQVGGNLAEVIDRIAETLRQRVRLRGEVRALTAQGRLSGWVVGMLPAALLVLVELVNPNYLAPLLAPGIGRVLLGLAAVSEGIGAFLIRRMVQLDL